MASCALIAISIPPSTSFHPFLKGIDYRMSVDREWHKKYEANEQKTEWAPMKGWSSHPETIPLTVSIIGTLKNCWDTVNHIWSRHLCSAYQKKRRKCHAYHCWRWNTCSSKLYLYPLDSWKLRNFKPPMLYFGAIFSNFSLRRLHRRKKNRG